MSKSVADVNASHSVQTAWLCVCGPRESKSMCAHVTQAKPEQSIQVLLHITIQQLASAAHTLQCEDILWIAFQQHPPELQSVLQGNSQHKPP